MLWEKLSTFKNKYNIYLSEVTIREIENCSEPKRTQMINELNKINYTLILVDKEIEELAYEIIKKGILSEKHIEDCRHIASAIVTKCDIIIS